jgi:hypothetical protein
MPVEVSMAELPPKVYFQRYMAQLRSVFSSQAFLEDSLEIARLDAEHVFALSEALAKSSDFLDTRALRQVVNQHIHDENAQDVTARFIRNFSQYHQGSRGDITQFVQRCEEMLRKAVAAKADFPIDEFLLRFRQLVCESAGLAKQWKAERLSSQTGIEIDKVSILCDMRPIFDTSRQNIDGIVLISTMKIEFDDSECSKSVEVRLTKSDLARLRDEATSALSKIEAIGSLCERSNLRVANTESE